MRSMGLGHLVTWKELKGWGAGERAVLESKYEQVEKGQEADVRRERKRGQQKGKSSNCHQIRGKAERERKSSEKASFLQAVA